MRLLLTGIQGLRGMTLDPRVRRDNVVKHKDDVVCVGMTKY